MILIVQMSVFARYYDAELGRFINSDDISYLDPGSINGLNLYAYAKNNPIMMIDPNGHMPFFLLTGLIGAVLGAVAGEIIAAANGQNVWTGIGIGSLTGGLIGIGVGAAYAATVAGSFFASTSAVVAGTQIMGATIATGEFTMAGKMALDNWGNSFSQVAHIFWSGGESAKNSATDFAEQIGRKTIGMTRVGTYLESFDASSRLWDLASANFANTANGISYAFVANNSLNSTFWTVEYFYLLVKKLIFK